jgi:hypothetical protein
VPTASHALAVIFLETLQGFLLAHPTHWVITFYRQLHRLRMTNDKGCVWFIGALPCAVALSFPVPLELYHRTFNKIEKQQIIILPDFLHK